LRKRNKKMPNNNSSLPEDRIPVIVGVGEIAVEHEHREFAVGDALLFSATDQPSDLLGEFLHEGRGLFLAPGQRQPVE